MTNSLANPATIAEAVRHALAESGLTMNSLSIESGISYPTLRRHLVSRPDLLTIGQMSAIARALNVPLDSFFVEEKAVSV